VEFAWWTALLCYEHHQDRVTNIIKTAEYAGVRNKREPDAHYAEAEIWAPVLRWQLETAKPRLLVLMGGRVVNLAVGLARKGLISLPPWRRIYHYSYVASRPDGGQPKMHPDRVAAYFRDIWALRTAP
jgi:uracil-DNA glycosylase